MSDHRLLYDINHIRGAFKFGHKRALYSETPPHHSRTFVTPDEPEFRTCDSCWDSFPAKALKDGECKQCRKDARA